MRRGTPAPAAWPECRAALRRSARGRAHLSRVYRPNQLNCPHSSSTSLSTRRSSCCRCACASCGEASSRAAARMKLRWKVSLAPLSSLSAKLFTSPVPNAHSTASAASWCRHGSLAQQATRLCSARSTLRPLIPGAGRALLAFQAAQVARAPRMACSSTGTKQPGLEPSGSRSRSSQKRSFMSLAWQLRSPPARSSSAAASARAARLLARRPRAAVAFAALPGAPAPVSTPWRCFFWGGPDRARKLAIACCCFASCTSCLLSRDSRSSRSMADLIHRRASMSSDMAPSLASAFLSSATACLTSLFGV
jgi:hypothetical protein